MNTLFALGVFIVAAYYSVNLNPEISFFKQEERIKSQWAEKMSAEHPQKVVFFGGSSCAFSIQAKRLTEIHGMPSANLGLSAGLGPLVISRYAAQFTRSGDTLIMAMEPDLMGAPLGVTSLGAQFAFGIEKLELLSAGNSISMKSDFSWAEKIQMLRPGGYHFFTILGKIVSGRDLYRYHISDLDETGWRQTEVKMDFTTVPLMEGKELPLSVKELLDSISSWSEENDVRLAYSLPWGFVEADKRELARKSNLEFLIQVAAYMPILNDSRMGVYEERTHFADTSWHLNETGAELRTEELAAQIGEWRVLEKEELENIYEREFPESEFLVSMNKNNN